MNFYTQKTIILMILVCIISDSSYSECLDCLDTLKSVGIPITKENYETYTFFFDWWTKNDIYNYSGIVSSATQCTVEKWGNGYGLEICNLTTEKRNLGLRNAKEYCIKKFDFRRNMPWLDSNNFLVSCTNEIENDGLKYEYAIDNFAFQSINFNIESNLSKTTKIYKEYLNRNVPTADKFGEILFGTGPLCCIKDLEAVGFKNFLGDHKDIPINEIEAARIEVSSASAFRRSRRLDDIDRLINRYIENDNFDGYNDNEYDEEYPNRSNVKYNRYYDTVGSYNRNLIRDGYLDDCGRIKNIVTRKYCQFVRNNYHSQIKVIHDFRNSTYIQHTEELTKRSYLENYKHWCWHYYRNQ